jgi:hypothetical protein
VGPRRKVETDGLSSHENGRVRRVSAGRIDGNRSGGQFAAHDPGVRGGSIDAGNALGSVATTTGLTDFFNSGLGQFAEEQTVQGDNNGLGPRFNSNACASCHSQPAVGGTSPSMTAYPFVGQNPQVQFADAHNALPSFITPDGPAREARFKFFLNRNGSLSDTPDGGCTTCL